MSIEDENKEEVTPEAEPKTITYDYLKSPGFRSIHVDGVFGGPSPSGKFMRLAIFNERQAIPTRTVHQIIETGDARSVSDEIRDRRETRGTIIREIEADLVIDMDTAVVIWAWLGRKLIDAKKIPAPASEGETSESPE